MSEARNSAVSYAWDDDQSPPLERLLPLPMQPYIDPLYIPPVARLGSGSPRGDEARLKINMVPAKARLHTELSNLTEVWVYRQVDEQLPESLIEPQVPIGPTIEVQRGQRVHIDWVNALTEPDGTSAPHPVVAVLDLPAYVQGVGVNAEGYKQRGAVHASENLLGFTGGKRDQSVINLPPWTVVHLHGGRTVADYDGWPENGYYPGQVQSTVYENNQPGTLLWYHDHGMAITRLNVYAGLAGLYLIRDPLEVQLGLPRGAEDNELLLLVQDRALTCGGDPSGIRGDQLLHKTGTPGGIEQAPMEFFGPLTLVNGRIWPVASVRADVYRLRILNGSNARTYRLRFTDGDGNPVAVPMQAIGSAGGLLSRPVDLNDATQHPRPGTITLASAERIDVLVDFRAFQGQRLELRNSARSPFDGEDADPNNPLADFLTYPHMMCFSIGEPDGRHQLLARDQTLLPSATPWSYDAVLKCRQVERLVALVEGDDGVLQLRECAPLKDRDGTAALYWDWNGKSALPREQLALRQRGETRHRLYRLLPGMFSDTVHYLARDGDIEVWRLVNLSEDNHPIHIHLVQFKLLARERYSETKRVPDETDETDEGGAGGYEIHFDQSAEAIPMDQAETGWKDTIRVNPAEMAIIAVPFRDYAHADTQPDQGRRKYMTGRYMYHCHILEHEDHEMMLPFVVMPPEVVDHMHGVHRGGGAATSKGTPAGTENREAGQADLGGWYMEPDPG